MGDGLNQSFPEPKPFLDSMVLSCRFLESFTEDTKHWFQVQVENVEQTLRNAQGVSRCEQSKHHKFQLYRHHK